MANTGVAPAKASTGIVIGPVFSRGGLQYWYFACFPDSIVAVRQSMGAMFVLGMANDNGFQMYGLFGLAGALINHFLIPKAQAYRLRVEAMLRNTPTSQLRSKPNVVYEVKRLKGIACVAKRGAPLILPEIILETSGGSKQRFGVRPIEFKKACESLQQMYPGLFRLT